MERGENPPPLLPPYPGRFGDIRNDEEPPHFGEEEFAPARRRVVNLFLRRVTGRAEGHGRALHDGLAPALQRPHHHDSALDVAQL